MSKQLCFYTVLILVLVLFTVAQTPAPKPTSTKPPKGSIDDLILSDDDDNEGLEPENLKDITTALGMNSPDLVNKNSTIFSHSEDANVEIDVDDVDILSFSFDEDDELNEKDLDFMAPKDDKSKGKDATPLSAGSENIAELKNAADTKEPKVATKRDEL